MPPACDQDLTADSGPGANAVGMPKRMPAVFSRLCIRRAGKDHHRRDLACAGAALGRSLNRHSGFAGQRKGENGKDMDEGMDRKKVRFQMSLTEFIYNGCFAANNFLSVFLEAIGFSAAQMGLITAVMNGIGIAAQPTWGIISDRIRSVKKCFMLCMAGTMLCAAAVPPLSAGGGTARLLMAGMLMAMVFFFQPSNMMMEMWLVRVNDNPLLRIPYGSVRAWASAGYALISLAFVPVFRAIHVRYVYWFLAGFALLSVLLVRLIPAGSEGTAVRQKRLRLRDMPFRTLRDHWIIGYVIFEVLYQIPFGWRVTYMVFALKEFRVDTSVYGALMFTAGICEVPMLLMVKRLFRRLGYGWPLVMSVVILSAEYSLYAWGHSAVILFAAQLLRGVSFALYVSSRYQYLSRIAPRGLEGSTQALVNAVSALTNLAAAAAGGFLLEALGTRAFFAVLCGLRCLSGLFFIGLHFVGVRMKHLVPREEKCCLIRPKT